MTLANKIIPALIRAYQLTLAPLFCGGCCRFAPSCSHYAREAFEQYGLWRGLALTLRRVLRCNPWGGQGFDPLPPLSGQ